MAHLVRSHAHHAQLLQHMPRPWCEYQFGVCRGEKNARAGMAVAGSGTGPAQRQIKTLKCRRGCHVVCCPCPAAPGSPCPAAPAQPTTERTKGSAFGSYATKRDGSVRAVTKNQTKPRSDNGGAVEKNQMEPRWVAHAGLCLLGAKCTRKRLSLMCPEAACG